MWRLLISVDENEGMYLMARMTLEQLRIFLVVAEHLHFTRAAEALYVTQPAVSAAIQSLEGEYGVKLFHRIGRHIEITEAGRLLQLEGQKILDRVILCERGLRELNDLQRGELNLGSSLSIGNYWLPARISEFQRQYPRISVKCTLANADTICTGTANGQFDLGLVEGEVHQSLKNCLFEEIVGSDRLLIVVGKPHPWFEEAKITVTQLTQTAWVMRESGSGTQQRFEQALQDWGIDAQQLNVISVLNSGEMVKAVVENGVGATALSELMVKKELQLDTLRAVTVIDNRNGKGILSEIARPFLMLKHRQRFQSKLAIAFEQMLILSRASYEI
jgi:DNA-binding transcriptional LysR family regulator